MIVEDPLHERSLADLSFYNRPPSRPSIFRIQHLRLYTITALAALCHAKIRGFKRSRRALKNSATTYFHLLQTTFFLSTIRWNSEHLAYLAGPSNRKKQSGTHIIKAAKLSNISSYFILSDVYGTC